MLGVSVQPSKVPHYQYQLENRDFIIMKCNEKHGASGLKCLHNIDFLYIFSDILPGHIHSFSGTMYGSSLCTSLAGVVVHGKVDIITPYIPFLILNFHLYAT